MSIMEAKTRRRSASALAGNLGKTTVSVKPRESTVSWRTTVAKIGSCKAMFKKNKSLVSFCLDYCINYYNRPLFWSHVAIHTVIYTFILRYSVQCELILKKSLMWQPQKVTKDAGTFCFDCQPNSSFASPKCRDVCCTPHRWGFPTVRFHPYNSDDFEDFTAQRTAPRWFNSSAWNGRSARKTSTMIVWFW